jgi:hypothetical protein
MRSSTPANAEKSQPDQAWYATFSFLDVGGAISASQLQRLVAAISRLWRITLKRDLRGKEPG